MAAKRRKRKSKVARKYGKFVVRKGGFFKDVFLQKGGGWGDDYKGARRFSSVDAADRAGSVHGQDYGVFPIGKSRG
jgi:hypothetical protein